MTTCYLVFGPPRSGTSLVAGLLTHLGIHMGERLIPAAPMNAKGFFVDVDFEEVLTEVFDVERLPAEKFPPEVAERLRDLIVAREQRGVPWGVKSTYGCALVPLLVELCGSVKMIHTQRSAAASCASLAKHTEHQSDSITRLLEWCDTQAAELAKTVETLEVDFDRLIDNPGEQVERLAQFVGATSSSEAVAFVDASMRNF